MRTGVRSRLYKIRKYIEETLDCYVPRLGWQTQYSRVSFSNERYSLAVKATERQGRLLTVGLLAMMTVALAGLCRASSSQFFIPRRALTSLSIGPFAKTAIS
jgi:kynurenine 3-monooxygenase